jgi:hypothetical protein
MKIGPSKDLDSNGTQPLFCIIFTDTKSRVLSGANVPFLFEPIKEKYFSDLNNLDNWINKEEDELITTH